MIDYPTTNAREGESIRVRVARLMQRGTVDEQLLEAQELAHYALTWSDTPEQSCYDYELMDFVRQLVTKARDQQEYHNRYRASMLAILKNHLQECLDTEKPVSLSGLMNFLDHLEKH